jgi:hypothetical protein
MQSMKSRKSTQPRSSTRLKPAKYQKKLFVAWEVVPGIPHGAMDIEIHHTKIEIERYRLQQVPKKFYVQLLCMPEPEFLLNNLLRCYLGDGSE